MVCTIIEKDSAGVESRLSNLLENSARETLEHSDVYKVGLSGGSMVTLLANCLPNVKTDWKKWRFFFCDERVVPFDNSESTYGLYRKKVMDKIPISEEQFIKINTDLSAEEAAKDYIFKMSNYFPPDCLPRFDILLLGLGPDGHTCSLFPGHKLLEEANMWVCPINDSPKPPPSRITLTLPVINNAKMCIFAVTGNSKADVVKKILKDKENLPATRVQPTNGILYWILDKEAAQLIESDGI